MLNVILFALLSAIAIIAGLMMVTRRHPLSSALSLIIAMIALAGLYALLDAQTLAILQILVYAGAILALVVFVIMLLNVRPQDLEYEDGMGSRVGMALVFAFFAFAAVATAIMQAPETPFAPVAANYGTLGQVGLKLFQDLWFPFELVSLLLTVAIVGAVILAKRKLEEGGESVRRRRRAGSPGGIQP